MTSSLTSCLHTHLLHVWDSEKYRYFMCLNSELSENVSLKRTEMIFNRKKKVIQNQMTKLFLLKQAMRYTTDWN